MHRSVKRKLVAGLAIAATAAFAGGAYAATQNSPSNARQAFLGDVAKRLHVTPQQLSSALNGAFLDQLQAAVKSGRLTQAQANALEQRLKQKGTAAAVPFGFFGFGPRGVRPFGPGVPVPGGPGGPGGPGFGGPGLFPGRAFGLLAVGPGGLNAAASYLGLTDPQLLAQLASGKSLAQVATAKGKSVSGLESAITAAVKTRLDKLVTAKLITAKQEQKILDRLSARLSIAVNAKGMPFRNRLLPPHLRFWKGVPPSGAPAPPNLPVPVQPALPVPPGQLTPAA